jgi:hypothetical protein
MNVNLSKDTKFLRTRCSEIMSGVVSGQNVSL